MDAFIQKQKQRKKKKKKNSTHLNIEWGFRVIGTTLGLSGGWFKMEAHLVASEGAAITVKECQCVAKNTPLTASRSWISPGSIRISKGSCCWRLPGGSGVAPLAQRTGKKNKQKENESNEWV